MKAIYFMANEVRRAVKIGVSVCPRRRLSLLQTGSVETLRILAMEPGDEAREAELHKQFDAYRLRGEWFHLSGDIADYIASLPDPALNGVSAPRELDLERARHPDEVRFALKEGITKAALARKAGVHENTLRSVESDDWAPKWPTLVKLCDAVEQMKGEQSHG